MKQLVSSAVFGLALLVAVNCAEAKSFGGFKPGDQFKMKVLSVSSTKQVGISGTPSANPIPANVPKFRKGRFVSFRIRSGGRLTAKGLSIPFAHSTKGINEYNRSFTRGAVSITHNAEIYRKRSRAIKGNLNFFVTDNSGTEPVYYTVIYKIR